jgi:hypothetical protein
MFDVREIQHPFQATSNVDDIKPQEYKDNWYCKKPQLRVAKALSQQRKNKM